MKALSFLLSSFLIAVSLSVETTQSDRLWKQKQRSERIISLKEEAMVFSRILKSFEDQSMPTLAPTHPPHPSALPAHPSVWNKVGNDLLKETNEKITSVSTALSYDGSILALGSYTPTNARGEINVYKLTSNSDGSQTWEPMGQKLEGSSPNDNFGAAVALSSEGTIMAVGATENDIDGTGYVLVFKLQDDSWVPIGQPLFGRNETDAFGYQVALSGDGMILAVLACNYDRHWGAIGFSQVYHWNAISLYWELVDTIEKWSHHEDLTMSLSNDDLVLALGDTRDSISGTIRAYACENDSGCERRGQEIKGVHYEELIGTAVSLSGTGRYLAVGSPGSPDCAYLKPTCVNVKVYEYQRGSEPLWTQVGPEINGEMEFASIVKLSADGLLMAVHAPVCDLEDCFYAYESDFRILTQLYRLTGSGIWVMQDSPLEAELLDFSSDGFSVAGRDSMSTISVYRRDR